MQLGMRPKVPFPHEYKGFRLIRSQGRVLGIPAFLDAEEVLGLGRLHSHPAVLSASCRQDLEALIDGFDAAARRPQFAGTCEGYDLYRHAGSVYAVPQGAGNVDLDVDQERRRAGVLEGATCEEARERVRRLRDTVPVEFAGWLPIYAYSGNCGQHPQFTHTAEPPPGYRFTYSAPPERPCRPFAETAVGRLLGRVTGAVRGLRAAMRPFFSVFRPGAGGGPRARLRVLGALLRLFFALRRSGARLGPILRFLQSRHFQSQILLGDYPGLVFLTSMPFTYGQNPWVIEIEDPTTLFYPLIQNGHTGPLAIRESPYFPIVKTLLESDQCKGILTHMKSTAALVPTLFGSEAIRNKVSYTPLGVKLPERWQAHDGQDPGEPINVLFVNSWCQVPENFYLRGGLDVLEAFATLHERYPQLRLTLRTHLPALDGYYHRIIEAGWVRVVNRFLPPEEMDALLAESHVYLLPAARVHIVSLLQAMSYGLAVVTSDGWGIEEYVGHERNGLIVRGRYGKASWADEQAGMLREDYEAMWTSDPEVVAGVVEAVSRLVEDPGLRRRLGRAARQDVEANYTLGQWNRGLKAALDRAMAGEACGR
jgi:glycosyltransferase involved in cell wall biosynthesis